MTSYSMTETMLRVIESVRMQEEWKHSQIETYGKWLSVVLLDFSLAIRYCLYHSKTF